MPPGCSSPTGQSNQKEKGRNTTDKQTLIKYLILGSIYGAIIAGAFIAGILYQEHQQQAAPQWRPVATAGSWTIYETTYPNFQFEEDETVYLATAPRQTWLFNFNYSDLLLDLQEVP